MPPEIAIGRLPGERGGVAGKVVMSGSDRPGLVWTWMRRATPAGPLDGVMSDYADTREAGAAYADGLLRVVLASFKAGCAPAPLPARIPWKRTGPPVSGGHDFAAELFGEVLATQGDAEKELPKATGPPSPTCPIIP